MLPIVLAVCARRRAWSRRHCHRPARRERGRAGRGSPAGLSLRGGVAGSLVVLVAAPASTCPAGPPTAGTNSRRGAAPATGTARLGSVAGQNRYQFWSAAVKQNATEPLTGTGSGTFEFWWARDGDDGRDRARRPLPLHADPRRARDRRAGLLAAFLLASSGAASPPLTRRGRRDRSPLAAALAGCAAFCLTAVVDWMWQIPVLPVALLLLAAVLVMRRARSGDEARACRSRSGCGSASRPRPLAAIVAIAIPLASTTLLRRAKPTLARRSRRGAGGGAERAERAAGSGLAHGSSRPWCWSSRAPSPPPPPRPGPRPRASRPTGGPGWSSRGSRPSMARRRPPCAAYRRAKIAESALLPLFAAERGDTLSRRRLGYSRRDPSKGDR